MISNEIKNNLLVNLNQVFDAAQHSRRCNKWYA